MRRSSPTFRYIAVGYLVAQAARAVGDALSLEFLPFEQLTSIIHLTLPVTLAAWILVTLSHVWLASMLGVIPLVLDAFAVGTYFFPPPFDVRSVQPLITVFHENVLYGNSNRESIVQLLKNTKPDIAFLVETDTSWQPQWKELELAYPYQHHFGTEPDEHAAVISTIPLEDVQTEILGDPIRPVFIANFRVANRLLSLVAAHLVAPMSQEKLELRNRILALLSERISEVHRPVIVLADLNTSLWSHRYRQFEDEARLINCRRGKGILSSWRLPYTFLDSPIDHVMVRDPLVTLDCRLGESAGSDHTPIIASIGFR